MSSQKYPLSLRVLHWIIAVLILSLIAVGWYMSKLPRTDSLRPTLVMLHKSFGVTVLALVLLRLFLRLTKSLPALPEVIPALDRKMAKSGYVVFYFLMIATPLVGILMTNAFGFAVSYFGWFDLPRLITMPDREMGKVLASRHEFLAYSMLAMAAVHVLAVIKHYVRDKVNLLNRMW